MRTIFKGHIIHAPQLGELSIIPGGCLVLEDGAIAAVCDAMPPARPGDQIEDYGDCLLLQSFADLHLHAPQFPLLGMGMDLPLLEWLDTYTFPMEAYFADTGYARRAYRRLAGTLLSLGTTRVCMFSSVHREATLVLMEELEQAGVAGYVGKVDMDRNCPDALRETDGIASTRRWLADCAGRFSHIRPILTPRFTPACSDGLLQDLGALAAETGLPVQSHLSENPAEVAWVRELHPDCEQYWESYAKYGLWNGRTAMAHCVYSDRRERQAMGDAGVLAVHCPDSNTSLSSGIAPVRRMLEEGVKVALGSDIAGGAELAMNRVAAGAIRASKLLALSDPDHPAFLTVPEAYYLATTAGHQFFGAGAGFAVGDKLHAIVVDDSALPPVPRPLTLPERLERALYLMGPSDIRAVYSEGRKVSA